MEELNGACRIEAVSFDFEKKSTMELDPNQRFGLRFLWNTTSFCLDWKPSRKQ